METIEFFKGLEDSIKKKEIIDKIVECYEESYKSDYERYSHSMYEKIVKTMFDEKVMGRYNVRERFNFELYCFNEWKNSILNYNINNIHQDYQLGFIKLQRRLRNFNPTIIEEIYDFLENTYEETNSPKYTNDEDYQKVLDSIRYNRIGEESTWQHVASNYIYMNQHALYDVHHRFYINTDSTYTDYFARLLMEKCKEKKYKYYFKLDNFGDRADTIVVYCSDTNLLKFLDILKEIKKEHPELEEHLHRPPFLTANIDDWIGYASEPSVKDGDKLFSFNSLRTKILDESMTKLNKEWIQKNKNRDIIANGTKSKFIDYITEMVLNEQMASFKRTEKCDVFSKTDVEFANRHGFKRESLNSNIFISMYRNYVKKEIIKLIDKIDTYSQEDIDNLIGYNGKSIKLEKQSIEKALRKMLYITRANVQNFDDKLREEIYQRGEKYNLTKQNIAFDAEYIYTTISKEQQSTTESKMSYQAKKQYKERPKQYTYKPMTDQEILDARRKIGL